MSSKELCIEWLNWHKENYNTQVNISLTDEELFDKFADENFGCGGGNHDPVPTLGYENAIIGEQCRVCGINLNKLKTK